MAKIYNKLVRDRIPEIIKANGEECVTRILTDEEYTVALRKKLEEEMIEYLNGGDVEELADIYEVILAILNTKGVSATEFDAIRAAKADKRGAFKDKIFLVSTDKKD